MNNYNGLAIFCKHYKKMKELRSVLRCQFNNCG
jgi:hypothetical protein